MELTDPQDVNKTISMDTNGFLQWLKKVHDYPSKTISMADHNYGLSLINNNMWLGYFNDGLNRWNRINQYLKSIIEESKRQCLIWEEAIQDNKKSTNYKIKNMAKDIKKSHQNNQEKQSLREQEKSEMEEIKKKKENFLKNLQVLMENMDIEIKNLPSLGVQWLIDQGQLQDDFDKKLQKIYKVNDDQYKGILTMGYGNILTILTKKYGVSPMNLQLLSPYIIKKPHGDDVNNLYKVLEFRKPMALLTKFIKTSPLKIKINFFDVF
jgi:hypothetical protein